MLIALSAPATALIAHAPAVCPFVRVTGLELSINDGQASARSRLYSDDGGHVRPSVPAR
jgi:hypothetical protein